VRKASGDTAHAAEAHRRLERLEELVTTLAQKDEKNLTEHVGARHEKKSRLRSTQATRTIPDSHLDVQGSETVYLGATHWGTVLQEVSEHDFLGRLTSIDKRNSGFSGPWC
jgi:hypothetical protein